MKRENLPTLALIPFLGIATASFNCLTDLDGSHYDLTALAGIRDLSDIQKTPPSTTNFTWHINPCGPLDESKLPKEEQCPSGTQICGVKHVKLDGGKEDIITEVVPVCGDLDGNQAGANVKKLDKDKKNQDGLQVELLGGKWGDIGDIEAKIDFICDEKEKSLDNIKFLSWENKLLSLEWKTKHACKRNKDDKGGGDDDDKQPDKGKDDEKKPEKDESSSWGFFTWVFVLFVLGVAAYVIAMAWINYNRYGLTGVDMLPQSDTLRDLPFLVRDFFRKIINTFAGGNRGGYSAV